MKDLDNGQKEAAFGFQNSVEAMASSISGNYGKTEEDDRNKKQYLSNIEYDLSSAKEDVPSTCGKLDSALKLFAPKN